MRKFKKFFSLFLCLCILMPTLSSVALAEENSDPLPNKEAEVTEEGKDSKDANPQSKQEIKKKDGKSILTVEVGGNGNAAIHRDGKEIALIIPDSDTVIDTSINDELEVRAYGKDAKLVLSGATEIKKTVSKNDDNITVFKIKITDNKAKAKLSYKPAEVKEVNEKMLRAATGGRVTRIADLNGTGIGKFWVSASGGNLYGVCCERENSDVAVAGNWIALTKLSNSHPLARIAYYGYRNSGSEVNQYITSAAASYTRNGNNGNYSYWNEYKALAKKAQNGTLASGPLGFEAYIGSLGTKQHMLLWRTVPVNGYLTMTKEVANNKELVNQCPNMYTLEGAEYTVRNSNGSVVGTLKTNKDGKANTLTLKQGTYTVKETKAPNGFALDPKTYTVKVTANKTSTFTSKEEPLFDPMAIVLEKIAEDGKTSYVNKNADMSGAEFTVKYYDSLVEDITNLSPKRIWKITTKKHPTGNYVAMLREEYKLSDSDEFFKNETGREVIPRGQITIQETKAPIGYKVDPKVYTYKIEKDSQDQLIKLNFGNTPEQPNTPLVPSIKTTASDIYTKDNVGSLGETLAIKDKVAFKELVANKTYTVKGKLMEKNSSRPLLIPYFVLKTEPLHAVSCRFFTR